METLPVVNDQFSFISSHSLGKLIEWKHTLYSFTIVFDCTSSHSLGKLIEWKRGHATTIVRARFTSHSLGKLIEWKLFTDLPKEELQQLPTRWEN